jgi:hypothetical protein
VVRFGENTINHSTDQIIWTLLGSGGQTAINIQLSGEMFDLLA